MPDRISSDEWTGDHWTITVTMTTDGTTWEPNQVVVFLGATAGGGPSFDCC